MQSQLDVRRPPRRKASSSIDFRQLAGLGDVDDEAAAAEGGVGAGGGATTAAARAAAAQRVKNSKARKSKLTARRCSVCDKAGSCAELVHVDIALANHMANFLIREQAHGDEARLVGDVAHFRWLCTTCHALAQKLHRLEKQVIY